jgi:uncharacterized membrane protein YcaP (DUF421 family)
MFPGVRSSNPEVAGMWQDLFSVQIPIIEKVLRTIATYAVVLLIIRLIGKRSVAAMSTMDFVVTILLSNVVQNAVIGPDNSWWGGMIGAVTLVGVNALVDWGAYRSDRIRRWVEGKPVQVIVDGEPQTEQLHRIGLRVDELDRSVRLQQGDSIDEVALATLQPGGQLVIDLKPDDQSASYGDVRDLTARLDRIEQLLLAGRTPAAR